MLDSAGAGVEEKCRVSEASRDPEGVEVTTDDEESRAIRRSLQRRGLRRAVVESDLGTERETRAGQEEGSWIRRVFRDWTRKGRREERGTMERA